MLIKKPLLKNELEFLYKSGLSMPSIAKILNCSIHKVVYWMDQYKIKRRSMSDAVYLQQNPNGDPFKIKAKLNKKDSFLLGLGLGIIGVKVKKQLKEASELQIQILI